jgi:putative phosphotransacetylase
MMKPCELRRKIREIILVALYNNTGRRFVPVAVSNKHVHLSRQDADILFGTGYEFEEFRPLVQPGQFAAKEKLSMIGPKGRIDGIRVLGPIRPKTQAEFSVTDSFVLGIDPDVRMSGDLAGSPGIRLASDRGEVEISEGAIVAARHLHMSEEQAAAFGLKNGQEVSLRKTNGRNITLHDVIVRSGNEHELEVHLDTDEANAAMIKSGDILEIVKS